MTKIIATAVLVTSLVFLIYTNLGFTDAAIILDLPGLSDPINFKQYSGYMSVDFDAERKLFYWFVESQSDPSTDPLVLWLNGGPGCSSLLGFFEELGPLYIRPNLTVGVNEYSWNRVANVLFLESPVNVGFSRTTQKIEYGDEATAKDSLEFLLQLFKEFPALRNREFWISGESYAGHYIPTLAAKILEHNQDNPGNPINLKGLMIGNPLTKMETDEKGNVDFIYNHNLISKATYDDVTTYCNFTLAPESQLCSDAQTRYADEMGSINPYDIYVDVCRRGPSGRALLRAWSRSSGLMEKLARRQEEVRGSQKLMSPFNPCEDNFLRDYLNQPSVQKAIHAVPVEWAGCNLDINDAYSKKDFTASMIPIYEKLLIPSDLQVLVYTGDVDSICSAVGTRQLIRDFNLPVTTRWQPWVGSDDQVAGYTVAYKGLTYATVRGAGHEVPMYKPRRALDMFSRFLRSGSVLHK